MGQDGKPLTTVECPAEAAMGTAVWPRKTMVHRALAPLGKKGAVCWSLPLSTGLDRWPGRTVRRGRVQSLCWSQKTEMKVRKQNTTTRQERVDQLSWGVGRSVYKKKMNEFFEKHVSHCFQFRV